LEKIEKKYGPHIKNHVKVVLAYNLDGENGIYKYENWNRFLGSNSPLRERPAAVIFSSHNPSFPYNFFTVDILFNYRDYEFSTNLYPSKREMDFRTILRHEVGHLLGLVHTESEESIMFSDIQAGSIQYISDKDKEVLAKHYNETTRALSVRHKHQQFRPEDIFLGAEEDDINIITSTILIYPNGDCFRFQDGLFTDGYSI
ncbi:MAG: matrixin family metalloprotease, partial [Halobacteriovoraceae bacterium]|nr:matrixin family metalloprotease [Halobacteriovoraceae bacterium]